MVAIVTPFDEQENIDYDALTRLLDFHLSNNTDGVVVCGTTGETPTLTTTEYERIIRFTVQHINGKIPVIAGSGSNSTKVALQTSKIARDQGVDGLLIASPYYNKPTPKGLYLHFEELANHLDLPIILYNVPSRTGVNMTGELIVNLGKEFTQIVAVKEASGNLEQIRFILDNRPEEFAVYSGDDNLAVEVIAMGGDGCISVIANEIPADFSKMIHLALSGSVEQARSIHNTYAGLMELNFAESNPIPVKTALHHMGFIQNIFRLPMCTMESPGELLSELKQLNLTA